MKKHWGAFWITQSVLLAGVSAAALALLKVHYAFSVLAGVSGIVGMTAYWLHFRSLDYALENGSIIICKGVLIKSRREIPLESVLITQSLSVLGYTLLTSVTTAGGSAVMFCELADK